VISSDLDEIFALSDTIAVFYRGEIAGMMASEKASRELIGRLMVGVRGA
jgi:simple sugar transport system ATP-binding protein